MLYRDRARYPFQEEYLAPSNVSRRLSVLSPPSDNLTQNPEMRQRESWERWILTLSMIRWTVVAFGYWRARSKVTWANSNAGTIRRDEGEMTDGRLSALPRRRRWRRCGRSYSLSFLSSPQFGGRRRSNVGVQRAVPLSTVQATPRDAARKTQGPGSSRYSPFPEGSFIPYNIRFTSALSRIANYPGAIRKRWPVKSFFRLYEQAEQACHHRSALRLLCTSNLRSVITSQHRRKRVKLV
jgi:hypothetical protein